MDGGGGGDDGGDDADNEDTMVGYTQYLVGGLWRGWCGPRVDRGRIILLLRVLGHEDVGCVRRKVVGGVLVLAPVQLLYQPWDTGE